MTNHPHRNWRRRMERAARQWLDTYMGLRRLWLDEVAQAHMLTAYQAGYLHAREKAQRRAKDRR